MKTFFAFIPGYMWDALNYSSITLLGLMLAQLRLSVAKLNSDSEISQKRKHHLSSAQILEAEQITGYLFARNRSGAGVVPFLYHRPSIAAFATCIQRLENRLIGAKVGRNFHSVTYQHRLMIFLFVCFVCTMGIHGLHVQSKNDTRVKGVVSGPTVVSLCVHTGCVFGLHILLLTPLVYF